MRHLLLAEDEGSFQRCLADVLSVPVRKRRRRLKEYLQKNPCDATRVQEAMEKEEMVQTLTVRCLQSLTPMVKKDGKKDTYPYFVSCARHCPRTLYNVTVLKECIRVRLKDYYQVPTNISTVALRNYCRDVVHYGLPRTGAPKDLPDGVVDVVQQEYLHLMARQKIPFLRPKKTSAPAKK